MSDATKRQYSATSNWPLFDTGCSLDPALHAPLGVDDKSIETCRARFSNHGNFKEFPKIPLPEVDL